MTERASIQDVARESGFSATTVSHALNGRGRVSARTRGRIEEVADRLGYKANPGVRKQRGASTGLIGLIARLPEGATWSVGDLDFLVRLERAFCDRALEQGRYPIILSADRAAEALRSVPLDGAVVVDPVEGDATLALLDAEGLPFVTLGRDLSRRGGLDWVVDNDKLGMTCQTLDLLAERGMRSVSLLTAASRQSYTTEVARAFESWTAERRIPSSVLRFEPPFDEQEVYERVRELLDRTPVDTLYLGIELFTRAALDAVRDTGLRSPEDVQLFVAADGALARASRPSVSAVEVHPERIGVALLDMLLEGIASGERRPRHVRVGVDLLLRESTRAVGQASGRTAVGTVLRRAVLRRLGPS